MEFIDLHAQRERIREQLDVNIQKVVTEGKYILGPEVSELEKRLSQYVGVKHAVGCASGTDALLMALMARGVGAGDAVFTTPFTFIATAEVIALLGATPVFVDVDKKTFNMSPPALLKTLEEFKLGKLPNGKSAAALDAKELIAVDIFG